MKLKILVTAGDGIGPEVTSEAVAVLQEAMAAGGHALELDSKRIGGVAIVRDGTPLPRWMNGISSYSMWWILIQHSWYHHHGDLDYLRQQKAYLTGLLQQIIAHIGPDNRETLPEWRFLDWPSNGNNQAIHAGLQALMILTLDAGKELCGVLSDSAMQTKCRETVVRLRQHVPDCGNSKQAAALMVLAGLGDPVALNREVLAIDGVKRMSTFYHGRH